MYIAPIPCAAQVPASYATNDLTQTTTGAQTDAYVYNRDGTLVSQTANGSTTNYTQDLAADQSQILAATTGITPTDYLYGQDTAPLAALSGGVRTWYGIDGQGSVRQSLDDSGNILGVQNYDPFGQIEAGSSLIGPFGYTGELQDATTGQEYLRARWYQPGSGTLLGVDPSVDTTGQPYAYGLDDPTHFIDPSGLIPQFGWNCFRPGDTGLIDGLFQGHDFAESFYLWRQANPLGACEVQIPRAAYKYWQVAQRVPDVYGIADVVENIAGDDSNLWEFAPVGDLPAKLQHEMVQAAFYVWRASDCPSGLPILERILPYSGSGYARLSTEWTGPRNYELTSTMPGASNGELTSPPVWFPNDSRDPSYIYVVHLQIADKGVIGFKLYRWPLPKDRLEKFRQNAQLYASAPVSTRYGIRAPTDQLLHDYWEPYEGGAWGKAPKQWVSPRPSDGGPIDWAFAVGAAALGLVARVAVKVGSVVVEVLSSSLLSPANAPV